ncbi:MAG: hypothetical protein ACO1N0_19750 [Fluviicola sp.]|jgi:hypothetical protein
MTRLVFYSAVLLVMTACNIKPDSSKAKQEDPIIELRVKLISNLDSVSKKLFYCGTLEVRQTFKFRVIRVIDGAYKNKYISINIQCPLERIKSKFLVKNRKYRFKLKRRKTAPNVNTSQTRYTGDFEIVSSDQ